MKGEGKGIAGIPHPLQRRIGAFGGDRSGPLVVCVGGIHGNEWAGVAAARNVLDALESSRPPFHGRFLAVTGNLQALEEGRRYMDRDLNRQWTAERIREVEEGSANPAPREDREMREILSVIREEIDGRKGPVFLLDLHTNSAGGAPFVCIGDTLRNRAFALGLSLPVVLGLEEQIDGALLEYINNRGHVTVGVEAGGHEEPSSVAHHEAVLWLALVAAGNVRAEDLPELDRHRARLASVTTGTPRIVEVRSHHRVSRDDGFRMTEGFRNFDGVRAGQVVAKDRKGPISVTEDCRLLLPLYQDQGSDGFFTIREVSAFWLALSGLLRRLALPRLMRWLPGVRIHPHREETLVVHTRLARFYPLQIFHLMGFRKKRWQGNLLLVSRRRYDLTPDRRSAEPRAARSSP